ncbi:NURF complex component [Radiomyces spectabilis]|uniref:NURF complex component n=1 Tax=Radiomyces spectabilis TaxID=64574 RepID=UPI00221EA439|nr:NURF complex component [Radiomyces spectabilis]KAI8375997.1 NURF complex component [Radiomyces spectabilis]
MSDKENDPVNEQQRLAEEYNTWKSTAPYLYDVLLTKTLIWPSLTCQWLPRITRENGFARQELMVGSHTNDEEPNYLQFFNVDTPVKNDEQNNKARLYATQQIYHEGEVNAARYQPSNSEILATKTRDGDVLVFDRTKTASSTDTTCHPMLRLKGHTTEGYGLAWNPHPSKSNHLLSAGYDHIICHWDIGMSTPDKDNTLQPYQQYKGHDACVEDVSWSAGDDSVFASVADDMKLMIWDTRTPSRPVQQVQAHDGEVNSVAFNPKQEWLIATGSSDKTIGLFDLRKLQTKLHSLEMHEGQVSQVEWNPHEPSVLASAADDRKIIIWDLSRIGQEQTPEDAEDGPPELMFMHSGHTSKISQFDWNPTEPWMIASTAEDNVVQVWQMSRKIYAEGDKLTLTANDLE